MIDTLAKRAASSRFALGGSAIRPPTGTFTQIERGYTLGLYTFTYVESNAPVWTVSFSSGECLRGGLVGTVTVGGLVGTVTTGGLMVMGDGSTVETFFLVRPDGTSDYFRPDGTSQYVRA